MMHRLRNLVRIARDSNGARRDAIRVWFFRLAGRVTPMLRVECAGLRLVVSTRETAGVGFYTFVHGGYEEQTIERVLSALERRIGLGSQHGLTVLEVGSDIGTETVSMLGRHQAARVVGIEPDPDNACFLRANLALNGLEGRAKVLELALSDVDANFRLERSPDNWGDHRIRVANPTGPSLSVEHERPTVEVPARTLDSLIEAGDVDLGTLDLVWMDVQGQEAHVLAGAQRLADAGIPIVTEYWPYGLIRAGALERFHRLVVERHDEILDLRPNQPEPPAVIAARDVAELADRYPRDAFAASTDLLLVPRG
jgi:FkbM family methyltransferase